MPCPFSSDHDDDARRLNGHISNRIGSRRGSVSATWSWIGSGRRSNRVANTNALHHAGCVFVLREVSGVVAGREARWANGERGSGSYVVTPFGRESTLSGLFNQDSLTRCNVIECGNYSGNECSQLWIATGPRRQNDKSETMLRNVLLGGHLPINSEYSLELMRSGSTQQGYITQSIEAYFGDGENVMSRKVILQTPRNTFIKQQFHIQ